jgi:hypothetical protein
MSSIRITNSGDVFTIRLTSGIGPRGASGAGGSGGFDGTYIYTAGQALSGHRAVTLNSSGLLVYCDAATLSHFGRLVGMTTGAASNNTDATIVTSGWEITEPGWSWNTSLPVFVGLTGLLTQTVPTIAGGYVFLQVIGWPITSTKLMVQFGEPLILS